MRALNVRLAEVPTSEPEPVLPMRSQAETNLQLLRHALALLGWSEGPPPGAIRIAKIDANIVENSRCGACKKKGQSLLHTWNRPPQAYMAVILCQCGHVEEM